MCALSWVACGGGGSEGSLTGERPATMDAGGARRDATAISLTLDAAYPSGNGGLDGGTTKSGSDAGIAIAMDGAASAAVDLGGAGGLGPAAPDCMAGSTILAMRPAEVLLVQDRSSSMAATITTGGTTKWEALTTALGRVFESTSAATAWGLMLFPKPSGDATACCQMPTNDNKPVLEVAPSPQAGQAIINALEGATPNGNGTPTARALIQGANALAARTTSTLKYMVLVSAGDPTCASDNTCNSSATLDDTRTKDAVSHIASVQGIPVGVVAIGLPTSSNSYQRSPTQQLFVDLANAGGMPNVTKGQPAYYQADTPDQLLGALTGLQGKMRSCAFAIASPVALPDGASVKVDGVTIARDNTKQDGWAFGDGGTSVVLYGKLCESYRNSSVRPTLELATTCTANPVVF